VDDLIVVATPDAVLVAHRNRVQEVRRLVEQLKAQLHPEPDLHREVYRPWGSFDAVDTGYRNKIKRITVKPSARLSRQLHRHRAEHWAVVRGTAKVTNGERCYLVTENESTFIPIGQEHCLENLGTIPLELIEVQSGSYLRVDDIMWVEGSHGRS